MEKRAGNEHPIHDLIAKRWSPRAFSDRPVSRENLLSLFEAARWAPSAFNEQPWHFMVATKDEPSEFERMLNCLSSKNRLWSKGAAALILTVAKTTFQYNSKPNRHAVYDLGQSAAVLTFQAESMGLRVHQMAGFSAEKVRASYAVPEGFDPVTAIAVGYPGDPQTLPEELKQSELAERTRRAVSEFVFGGTWKKRF